MQVQSTQTPQPTGTAQPPDMAANSSKLSSDFETFLQMLTAQARYQVPTEPLDSSDYAAQLAQFSMVEQQVRGNELLTKLTLSEQTGALAQYSTWVGMDVRSTAPISFDGTPVTVITAPDPKADVQHIVTQDVNGAELSRLSYPPGETHINWQALDKNGAPLPHDTYTVVVESWAGGQKLSTSAAQSYARVREVQQGSNGVQLVLAGGQVIPARTVTALRANGG